MRKIDAVDRIDEKINRLKHSLIVRLSIDFGITAGLVILFEIHEIINI